MIDGRTVCDLDPEGRAAIEIQELWQYLAGQLARHERRKVFQQPASFGFGRRASL